ncbi:MAG: hypothetical protein QM831_43910 [Kofleriaceae bacterium]
MADCNLSGGGMCITSEGGGMWCAYPDPDCPGGYRYSTQDVGDGLSGTCVAYTPGDDGGTSRTLTVNVGGSGMGVVMSTPTGVACSGGTCTMSFPVGTQISLAASATAGSFLGWSDGCVGAGACSVTLDQDRKVSALFGMPGEALWSTQIGGTQSDGAYGVAADSDGNLIVVGTFQGSFAVGTTTLTSAGASDIFVAKLMVSDGSVAWIKTFGSSNDEKANHVALDGSNNIYIAGRYAGTLSFGADSITSAGSFDGFVLSLDPTGGYRWAKSLGGQFTDTTSSIAVQGSTVVAVGSYAGSMTINNQTLTNAGQLQAYIVGFGTDGSAGIVKAEGGSGTSAATKVALASDGTIVIGGNFSGGADFGAGTVTSQSVDTFLATYSPTGAYLFAKALGGTSNDGDGTLAVSPTGYILYTGNYAGSVSFGGASPIDAGSGGLVAVSYSLAGAYRWAELFAGSANNQAVATDVTINSSGDAVLAGYFCGTVGFGSLMVSSVGSCADHDDDIYAVRLAGADGNPLSVSRAGGSMQDAAWGVAQAADGKHYVVGTFQGFADFGGTARTSAGATDAIVLGLAPL